MEWDQLAIIAQIATGIATLAVAIFLASQLRIQHKDSERDFAFAFENRQQALTVSIFADESTRKLYWKALHEWDSLSPEELTSFRFLYEQFYLGCWTAWRLRRDGDNLVRFRHQWKRLLEQSGQRRYYETFGRDILQRDQSLLDFVESVYQELEATHKAI